MKNKNQKTFTFVTLILITLLCLPIFCFALGNGKGVSTAWKVQTATSGSGEVKGEALILNKESSSGTIVKMYMYVGNVYNDIAKDNKISITLTGSSDKDTIIKDTYFMHEDVSVDISGVKTHSWVEVPIQRTYSANYIKFIFGDGFELFEVACFDKDNKFIPVSCYGAKIWKRDGSYSFVKATNDNNTFSHACDEQNQFSLTSTAKGLSQQELRLLGAINNVINGNGYYVSESENVLAVLFNVPAVLLFGSTSFGLRVTGFIFFLLTLYCLFFFAKYLFENNLYAVFAVVLYLISGLPISLITNANGVTIALFFILCSVFSATVYFKRATTAKRVRLNAKYMVISGALFAVALATSLYSLFLLPALGVLLGYPSVKGLIEITKEYIQSEGLEKEYLREKTIKTWSSVILSVVFGFIAMSFVVLLASYGLAYTTYCEFFGKNIFAVIFANHARIFASAPKGLFLSWIIGLGQLEYNFAMGASVYAFANRVLTFFALIAGLTLAILYLLKKCKVIKNGELLVALRDHQSIFVVTNLVFVSTYLLNVFLWGANNYANFLISLPFLLFDLLLAHNVFKFVLPKEFTKALSIIVLTVVGVFFAFHFVTIFKINLPEKIQPIVSWLIQ
ncbi:MAG: hypothetical protein IKJ19_00735 [Clostridia bacterium]|nr:hypothetical protein [Clostridia bacterium]